MSQVVIVDDDAELAAALGEALRLQGISAAFELTGAAGLERMGREAPRVVLLDVGLPDLDGLELCRRLRAQPRYEETRVVLLSGRATEPDRIAGFLAGADDFVAKPFSQRELVLRVLAALRRRKPVARVLTCGPIVLEASGQASVDGASVELTALETRLLRELMANPGRARTRSELIAHVWGGEHADSRTLDTHVLRLRDKLGAARGWLQTVRGVGYRMKSSR